jgi:hypothetical protein
MSKAEFAVIIDRINALWGSEFDTNKAKAWFEALGGLNPARLLISLTALSRECPYHPKISEIVTKYEEIVAEQARIAREREIDRQQKLLSSGELHYCYICRNDGIVFIPYPKNPPNGKYECMVRCSCGRGNDLNMWSRNQITKGMPWVNPVTKKEENIYVSNIGDVLTHEEIEIIKAKNMTKNHDFVSRSELKSMMQGFVNDFSAGDESA